MRALLVPLAAAVLTSCGAAPPRAPTPASPSAEGPTAPAAPRAVVLPGGPGLVRMDFIAYDTATRSLWVPAGNTGSVDVLDVTTDAVQPIQGFRTAEMEAHGERRVVGPSSVAVGDGVVYVGNRGDSGICGLDARARTVGGCATLTSMPDAIALVPSAHELWVTLPRASSLVVLHVDGLAPPTLLATVPLDGSPECLSVDAARGVVYTNLEDRDRTLAIDVATRRVTATWSPGCGDAGPRGLRIDPADGFLFVACTDKVVALDVAHDGAVLGSVATGGRLDDIAYAPDRRLLYVASGADATLRFVHVDEHGALSVVASVPTATGARNAVVDEHGRAYVADSEGGRIWIVDPPR